MSTLAVNSITDANSGNTATINSYTPTESNMAGRNLIINGNFDFWQRGTSFTGIANNGYSADRWKTRRAGSTGNITREAFTIGQTDVPDEPVYFARVDVTANNVASDYFQFLQLVEDVRSLTGNVTLSFYAKADSNKAIAVQIYQNFGTGGSPSATTGVAAQSITLTSSWQKFVVNFSLPSLAGKTLGTNNDSALWVTFWLNVGSNYAGNPALAPIENQSITFDVSQVQLEPGSVATPFERRPYGTELSLCQRYYYRKSYSSASLPFDVGPAMSGTQVRTVTTFPVTMRTNPSALEQTGTAGDYTLAGGSGGGACTSVPTFLAATIDNALTQFTTTTVTAGQAYYARTNVATAVYLGWSAEL